MRRFVFSFLIGLAFLAPNAASSQIGAPHGPISDSQWLRVGGDMAAALRSRPRERLRIVDQGGAPSAMVQLGRLAFRAPQVLGGLARRDGMSCQTCHTNGHVASGFFIEALSDRPGNVDVSHFLFNPRADDRLANPLNIPSLRGIAATAPYGHDGRFGTLEDFTRNVIVNEFQGERPQGWLLDALVAYMRQLEFLPGPTLTPSGRLTADAPAAARRGEAVFHRPFANAPALSCAACHPPTQAFADGRPHDVGTGGLFSTPSLLNVGVSAPFFHDGRASDLAAVVGHFDAQFELGLDDAEIADLVAYLDVVGAASDPETPVTLATDLDDVGAFLTLFDFAIDDEDAPLAAFLAPAVRHQVGLIHERFTGEGNADVRSRLVGWSRDIAAVGRLVEAGEAPAARERLAALRLRMRDDRPTLEAAAANSLYDPANLAAAFAGR